MTFPEVFGPLDAPDCDPPPAADDCGGATGELGDLGEVAEPLLVLLPLRDPSPPAHCVRRGRRVTSGFLRGPTLPASEAAAGDCGRSDAMLGCRLGARMLPRLVRLSPAPWRSLLSRRSETFMRRGFGVLKMVRFSRHLALLNSRRTTHRMTNMSARPTNTPIIAGFTV